MASDPHIKAIVKLMEACRYRHDLYTVFSDCMSCMALAISNAVDFAQSEAREARYLEIVRRYDRDVIDAFPKVLAEVTMALEAGPGDVLGAVFGALELHNTARGQFFTPFEVCRMMARMQIGDGAEAARSSSAKASSRPLSPPAVQARSSSRSPKRCRTPASTTNGICTSRRWTLTRVPRTWPTCSFPCCTSPLLSSSAMRSPWRSANIGLRPHTSWAAGIRGLPRGNVARLPPRRLLLFPPARKAAALPRPPRHRAAAASSGPLTRPGNSRCFSPLTAAYSSCAAFFPAARLADPSGLFCGC